MGNLKKSYIIFCLLCLLGFHIVYHLLSQPVQANSRLFIEISANLLKYGSYSFDGFHPTRIIQPLYTFFVLIFYHLLGLGAGGVIVAQIVLDLGAFVLILKTASLIFGRQIPRLLPLLLAGHVAIWFFGLYIINECLYIFITVCGLYFFVKGLKLNHHRDFILAGIMAGLALMTRPVGLGFVGLLFIPMLLFWKWLNRPWLKLILMYSAVLLVILPWTIRNGLVMGRLTPLSSEDRYHLLYASLPDSITANYRHLIFDPIHTEPDRVADSANIYRSAVKNIMSDPGSFAKRGIGKIIMVWTNFPGTREMGNRYIKMFSKVLQYGILVFTLIGFIYTAKKYAILLLLPAVFYSLILFFTYATTRFAVPALPFMVILTAQGFEPLMRRLERRPYG